jgi:hypothetical protein
VKWTNAVPFAASTLIAIISKNVEIVKKKKIQRKYFCEGK